MVAAAVIGGSALSAGASLLGGSAASSGASKAANTAAQEYAYTAQQENPFINAGYTTVDTQASLANAAAGLSGLYQNPYLNAAQAAMPQSVVTENWLQQTPGYQWQLGQGLKATQSAAAARGLGVSGASLKGAATYATELANSNYQSQFNNAQQTFSDWLDQNKSYYSNLQTAGNMLNQVSTLGQNAASQTGTTGATDASTAAQAYTNAGTATGQSYVGASNALNQGINNYLSLDAYNQRTQALQSGSGSSGVQANPGGSASMYNTG